jgi:hypothetical protein
LAPGNSNGDEPGIRRIHVLTPETLAEMEKLICQRLGGRLRDFRLSIRDAGLVLSGNTRSHHARQLAQHALMGMTQAPIRANEIEVRASPVLATPDAGVVVEASVRPADDESMRARAAGEFLSRAPTAPRTIGR